MNIALVLKILGIALITAAVTLIVGWYDSAFGLAAIIGPAGVAFLVLGTQFDKIRALAGK
jgi:hypothetical protein